jgi:hypothetical protein
MHYGTRTTARVELACELDIVNVLRVPCVMHSDTKGLTTMIHETATTMAMRKRNERTRVDICITIDGVATPVMQWVPSIDVDVVHAFVLDWRARVLAIGNYPSNIVLINGKGEYFE